MFGNSATTESGKSVGLTDLIETRSIYIKMFCAMLMARLQQDDGSNLPQEGDIWAKVHFFVKYLFLYLARFLSPPQIR